MTTTFKLPHARGEKEWKRVSERLSKAQALDWASPTAALNEWRSVVGAPSAPEHLPRADDTSAFPKAMKLLHTQFGKHPPEIMAFIVHQAQQLPALFPDHATSVESLPSPVVGTTPPSSGDNASSDDNDGHEEDDDGDDKKGQREEARKGEDQHNRVNVTSTGATYGGTRAAPELPPQAQARPHTFSELPLLTPTAPAEYQRLVLSRRQLCCLLAHGFLGTLMPQGKAAHGMTLFTASGELSGSDDYDIITGALSFLPLLFTISTVAKQRVLCMLLYFAQMKEHLEAIGHELVAFERHALRPHGLVEDRDGRTSATSANGDGADEGSGRGPDPYSLLQGEGRLPPPNLKWDVVDWASCDSAVGSVTVHGTRMEDVHPQAALLDFANRDLMIHEVIPSATQEEVLFSVRPELFVSMLFIPRLRPHEAAVFRNARMVIDYTGYQHTFAAERLLPVDPSALTTAAMERPDTCSDVVAIDAIMNLGSDQFQAANLHRDLNKAFVGFRGYVSQSHVHPMPPAQAETMTPAQKPVLSSGLWGCGVFGGNPVLKLLQQLMAASHLGIDLHFSTYKQDRVQVQLQQVVALIAQQPGLRVCDLYAIITSAPPSAFGLGGADFGDFVIHRLKERAGQATAFEEAQLHRSEEHQRIENLIVKATKTEEQGNKAQALRYYQRARAINAALFDALMMPSP